MDDWDILDEKHRLKAAQGGGDSSDPWGALDAKHLKQPTATSGPAAKPETVSDFRGNLQFATPFGTMDTGIGLPEIVNKRLAQIGSGVSDFGLAARQMLANDKPKTLSQLVTGDSEGAKLKREVTDKRQRDAQLNNDFTGKAFNFGGKVLPMLAAPNIGGPVVGGMLVGGFGGAFEPVAEGESRGFNTALGTTLGALIPGGVKGYQALVKPNQSGLDLARKAVNEYGIPLGSADLTGNRFVKAARSFLDDVPFIGSIGASQNNAKQEAFNAAVGGKFRANAKSLTPDVVDAAKTSITGDLNRIWEQNTLKLDGQFIQDLTGLAQKARDKLNPDQVALVDRQIQALLQKSSNGEIPGGFANNWQSELRLAVDGEKGLAQNILADLRKATLGAFNRGVAPEDAALLAKTRGEYGAFKTVEPLLTKGELGIAGRASGDVPAALLGQRVLQQYGTRAGQSPFGELPAIGNRFLVDRTMQTGGAPRAAIQNSVVALGATGAAGAGLGPLAGAGMAGLGAGAEWLLGSPTVAKSILNNPQARGLLGPTEITELMKELGKNSLRRLPIGMGPGLLGFSSAPALE